MAVKLARGIVKAYREHLNAAAKNSTSYRNHQFHQISRPYGDYLYAQDREMFFESMREEISKGTFNFTSK